MFAKIFALFALLAVAVAAPNPKPQVFYSAPGFDYVYPAAGVAPAYSPYVAAPVAAPVAYSAYNAAAPVYLR